MAKQEKNKNVQSETENVVNEENIVNEDNSVESTETSNAENEQENKKDSKDAIIQELKDRNVRQMAEFDNFRKRTEKEKSAMYEIGARDIIEKILPVVDNFERGFKAMTDEEKATPFAEGMDKVYKQFMKTLEDAGVKAIEAQDKEFNPDLHNAVMHVEDDSVGDNIIVEEFEKGYTYRDTVVRHSMVKVAN